MSLGDPCNAVVVKRTEIGTISMYFLIYHLLFESFKCASAALCISLQRIFCFTELGPNCKKNDLKRAHLYSGFTLLSILCTCPISFKSGYN